MLRAIREVSPRFVVGENVRGLTNWNGGMVFEEVCAELESYGYQVAPVIIPACAVGAPHRRERIWFVAYAPSIRNNSEQPGGIRSENAETNRQRTYPFYDGITSESNQGIITNSDGSEQGDYTGSNDRETEKIWRENKGDVSREFRGDGNVTNTDDSRLQSCEESRRYKEEKNKGVAGSIENGNVTHPKGERFQKPSKVGELERIGPQLSSQRNNWDEFPTQSPVCSGDDGLSSELDGITFPKWRNETIKAYGNAIVPQVAYQIFKAIEKTLYL
jgi:DNA (cytosine-5)-methyltransferase 1